MALILRFRCVLEKKNGRKSEMLFQYEINGTGQG